jgi:hypothetical protein
LERRKLSGAWIVEGKSMKKSTTDGHSAADAATKEDGGWKVEDGKNGPVLK